MKIVKEKLTWDEKLDGEEIPEDPEIYSQKEITKPRRQLPDKTDKIH